VYYAIFLITTSHRQIVMCKQKQNGARLKLTDTGFFFGTLHIV